MYNSSRIQAKTTTEFYAEAAQLYAYLLEGERSWLANMANLSALLFHQMEQVNWVGFYLWDGSDLVLGPFQGKPACVRITPGRGVCGTAFARREPVIVADVHTFPGHIACDPASRSEIVLPFKVEESWSGVLDIDSPIKDRFHQEDADGLALMLQHLVEGSDWDAPLLPCRS